MSNDFQNGNSSSGDAEPERWIHRCLCGKPAIAMVRQRNIPRYWPACSRHVQFHPVEFTSDQSAEVTTFDPLVLFGLGSEGWFAMERAFALLAEAGGDYTTSAGVTVKGWGFEPKARAIDAVSDVFGFVDLATITHRHEHLVVYEARTRRGGEVCAVRVDRGAFVMATDPVVQVIYPALCKLAALLGLPAPNHKSATEAIRRMPTDPIIDSVRGAIADRR